MRVRNTVAGVNRSRLNRKLRSASLQLTSGMLHAVAQLHDYDLDYRLHAGINLGSWVRDTVCDTKDLLLHV